MGPSSTDCLGSGGISASDDCVVSSESAENETLVRHFRTRDDVFSSSLESQLLVAKGLSMVATVDCTAAASSELPGMPGVTWSVI